MRENMKSIEFGPGALEAEQRLVSGYISTIDVDMIGDVVLPGGMDDDTYFKSTRSVNLYHDPSKPIGTNRRLVTRDRGVWATTYISKTPLGEDTLTMVKEGVIRGMSIEWDPRSLVSRPPTKEEKAAYGSACKRIFEKWCLTRYAFVPNPMNQFALVENVKSAPSDYLRAMQPIWDRMEELFTAGAIHRSSAVAAGFPDAPERKSWAVVEPKPRRVVVVDESGLVWTR
jgi:HK97 family phage prohead protease